MNGVFMGEENSLLKTRNVIFFVFHFFSNFILRNKKTEKRIIVLKKSID
jgi:hypothetical protein